VLFKAKTYTDDDHDDDSETSTNDDVAFMVKKFKRFMKKKGYQDGSRKSGKSYNKNPFAKKKCFECVEMGYISTNCKNKDEDNSSKKKVSRQEEIVQELQQEEKWQGLLC
jgi:hypothetical protein